MNSFISRLANIKEQWFQDNFPGATLNHGPDRTVVVLHTTEGFSWPTYNGGSTAPNLTGLPPLFNMKKGIRIRKGKWRQHFPLNKSSRALANKSGGVETNTLNAIQLELIGTCDPANAKSWGGKGVYWAGKDYVYWPKATKVQLNFVARMLADIHEQTGLRLLTEVKWAAYPGSYGEKNPNRLTFAQWRKTVGVVGHQHVPENSHGDPGDINITYILRRARSIAERRSALP